jgi:hypothetical protein
MKGEGGVRVEVEDRDVLTYDGRELGMETAWMNGKGVVIGRLRSSLGGRVKESSVESSDSKMEKGLG